MQFFSILAIAFAATGVSACKDDNIFCAPGMGHCLDAKNCKRSADSTFGGFSNIARTVTHMSSPVEAQADAE
ncbi:hypothetical protein DM02DRAFT_619545 [Periconia macrospinosa]|uniref:Extracellular membrane protein CFEM domain-containing protein n=1 Tax=Periconia macrospinosa TaxID=97972 RepID=A0A2V1D4S5_9PLEO|nr:hypothetical protein DM02DRAFT_619545 [Periconia macrospinosa]